VTAFEGLQVIDLSRGIAGPMVGMFLADFGADVVKVEMPEGDPARKRPGFVVWNRGKRGVVVDPADSERCRWLGDLVAGADVCIVSGLADLAELGLVAEDLLERAPALVLTVAAPYDGHTPRSPTVESNGLLAAALGVAWRQSSFTGVPIESVFPHLLYVHGVLASLCTVAALVERQRSGFGQTVTVTGANAVMHAQPAALSVNPELPDPDTAVGPAGRHPTYTRFQARDGKWLASGALGTKFETALLRALGIVNILDEPRLAGRVENLLRPDNVEWALGQVADAFRQRDRAEWMEIIAGVGIPCGPVDAAQDWLDHEQIRAIGMRVEVDDVEYGPVVMPGVSIQLTSTPGRIRGGAPRPGGHDADVIPRSPVVPAGPAPLSRGPLSGVRVVDLGTFVAAPYAGMLLAELGADVVKIEAPGGDLFRIQSFVVSRGMRSLEIDLKAPAGHDAFRKLAAVSDIVIEGLRPGVMKSLDLDYGALTSSRPDLVMMSLSGFGELGPLAGRPSVDMVLQAMSGMMAAQGGDDEPVINTMPIIDVTTAGLLALGSCIALFHRNRTGEGQRAWASLAATSALLESGEIVRYAGRSTAPVGGRDYLGRDPLDRYYQVSDGWLRIQALSPDVVTADVLVKCGLPLDVELFELNPDTALARVLAQIPAGTAVIRLREADIAACPARRISEVIRDPQLLSSEFVHLHASADGQLFTTPGRYASFSRTQRVGPLVPPGAGQHTAAVLAEAGLASSEVDALAATGVVSIGTEMRLELPAIYR
jgi:crotonobetainyl-CoA:carnitine CoA-transferase CaiB-like acyl-CoA transferase